MTKDWVKKDAVEYLKSLGFKRTTFATTWKLKNGPPSTTYNRSVFDKSFKKGEAYRDIRVHFDRRESNDDIHLYSPKGRFREVCEVGFYTDEGGKGHIGRSMVEDIPYSMLEEYINLLTKKLVPLYDKLWDFEDNLAKEPKEAIK